MRRAGSLLVGAGLLVAALAVAAARVLGEEVTLLARVHDAAEREEARRLHDARDDPAWIYGVPEPGGPVRVVLPEPGRRIVPAEDPGRVLYAAHRAHGEPPLLARTVRATGAAAGALLAGAGAACLVLARRRKA